MGCTVSEVALGRGLGVARIAAGSRTSVQSRTEAIWGCPGLRLGYTGPGIAMGPVPPLRDKQDKGWEQDQDSALG